MKGAAVSRPEPNEAVKESHRRLGAFARGLANDEWIARMAASWLHGAGALPDGMGLSEIAFRALQNHHFPGMAPLAYGRGAPLDAARGDELEELRALLLGHRAGREISESWIAELVAAACLGNDHLWQDLGLWSRGDLGQLLQANFPALAARNDRDMKWKKFLYKQLCETEGIYTCRSPSCEVCAEYRDCFGPEK